MTIVLDVIGLPAPQGSKTRMPNGAMVEGSSTKARTDLAAWRKAVADAARAWLRETPQAPLAEPVRLSVHLRFPLPASDPHRTLMFTAPDASKCLRAVEDALVHGGMLRDDRFVWDARVSKVYARGNAPIGARIYIDPMGEEEAHWREVSKETARERKLTERRAKVYASHEAAS